MSENRTAELFSAAISRLDLSGETPRMPVQVLGMIAASLKWDILSAAPEDWHLSKAGADFRRIFDLFIYHAIRELRDPDPAIRTMARKDFNAGQSAFARDLEDIINGMPE